MKSLQKTPDILIVLLVATIIISALTVTIILAQSSVELDENGNFLEPVSQNLPFKIPTSPLNSGDVLNSFPNPSSLRGLTFREGKLWGITSSSSPSGSGILFELDANSGTLLSTITISPLPNSTFGLGFDTLRNLFIVTNAIDDTILKIDPITGSVTDSLPAPGTGPVGAAYDATRDGYWISDWMSDKIYLIDPDTGVTISSIAAPVNASRIAGTGYDPINDILITHSRDSIETYIINASDGTQLDAFVTPLQGTNSGQGAVIHPIDQTGYLTNSAAATIFIVELIPPTLDKYVYLPFIMNDSSQPTEPPTSTPTASPTPTITPTPTATTTPIPGSGKVQVTNTTGGTLTFSLIGPTSGSWTVINGLTKTVDVSSGTYQMTVTAICGSATETFTITSGETETFSYVCVAP